MANLAGYGVRALLCAQDESQVIRVYGDYHALAANCQLRVSTSASLSARSVERERDLAGSEATVRRSTSRDGGWFGKVTTSQTEAVTHLVEAGELVKLARENVVVFSPGLRRPVVLRKMRYYEHPLFPRAVRCGGCAARRAVGDEPAAVDPAGTSGADAGRRDGEPVGRTAAGPREKNAARRDGAGFHREVVREGRRQAEEPDADALITRPRPGRHRRRPGSPARPSPGAPRSPPPSGCSPPPADRRRARRPHPSAARPPS